MSSLNRNSVGWNRMQRWVNGAVAPIQLPSDADTITSWATRLSHFPPPWSDFHNMAIPAPEINSRSMQHIPAPFNQFHVYSFASKTIICYRRAAIFQETKLLRSYISGKMTYNSLCSKSEYSYKVTTFKKALSGCDIYPLFALVKNLTHTHTHHSLGLRLLPTCAQDTDSTGMFTTQIQPPLR